MPAPTNQDSTTAIELGPLPSTFTQQVDFAGTTYTVWYKYTATFTGQMAFFAFGDLTVYKPFTHVHSPDDVTTYLVASAINIPIQIPVVNGTVYYFEVHKVGNVSPSNLTVNAQAFAPQISSIGALLINDDTPGFPAVVVSQTDGSPLSFLQNFAAGEGGDILDDGSRMAFEDSNAGNVAIYNAALTQVATSSALSTPIISTNKTSQFYVGTAGAGAVHAQAKTMSLTGTLGSVIGPFGAAGLTGMAPSPDESILYYTGQTSPFNAPVQRWTIGTNSAAADLAAGNGATYKTIDLVVLSDGTVLVLFFKPTATFDTLVQSYNAAGTPLHTFNFGALNGGNTNPRICRARDDPNSFWIWLHQTSGQSRFQNIKASDGSVLSTFDSTEYEQGAYVGTATATPTARFGHSFSCPLVVLRQAFIPPGTTGTIIVNKTTPGLSGITTSFPFGATGGLSPSSFSLTTGTGHTFSNVPIGSGYGVFETPPAGWGVSYTVSNASPITNLTVASGETVTVTAINAGAGTAKTDPIRRLRQTAHLSTEQVTLFFSKFQLDCEAGVGLNDGQGIDPQVMLSWSDDGGHTWSPEVWVSAGAQGEYKRRAIWRRLGRSRDRVWRIVVSDPVAWRLLAAYIDVKKGTS